MKAAASARGDEVELRYWLANEDWYKSRYTMRWQERTPHDEAADTLAEIAQSAQPEPRALWSVAATIFASSGLATSDGIAGGGAGARKAGTRAALMLAEMEDPRCIAPLVRVFSLGGGLLQNKYHDQITAALLRVLSAAAEGPSPEFVRAAPEVRTLAERIWGTEADLRRDLVPVHTELLRAALQFLAAAGGWDNTEVLRKVAASPVRAPNRLRARDCAQVLLTR